MSLHIKRILINSHLDHHNHDNDYDNHDNDNENQDNDYENHDYDNDNPDNDYENHDNDDDNLRYCMLSYVLCIKRVSARLRRRFPSMQEVGLIMINNDHHLKNLIIIR